MTGEARTAAERHFYAALDFFAAGETERAISEFEKAASADPTFTDPLHGLTRIYQDLDRLDEAIAMAKRIAETDPNDILCHTSLSILYHKKGLLTEAEAEANKARILGWKQQLKKSS